MDTVGSILATGLGSRATTIQPTVSLNAVMQNKSGLL